MFYKPDPEHAYSSIQHITNDVDFGWLVRGMHRWGASVFIILLFFHMARVFLYGAYKYPRELNWIIGVLLLILGMFEGFTGLPAAVRPDRLLGDRRRHEHHRERAVRRRDHGADTPGRSRDRRGHPLAVLLAAHAGRARSDLRADRSAPLPRRPPRRLVAAVVEGSRRLRARRGGARAAGARRAGCARRPAEGRPRELLEAEAVCRPAGDAARSSPATRRTSRSAGSRSSRSRCSTTR